MFVKLKGGATEPNRLLVCRCRTHMHAHTNTEPECPAVGVLLQVVFSYNPSIGQPVLKGVSFQAPGGKTLAIVGSTGSGKSSLLRWGGEGW